MSHPATLLKRYLTELNGRIVKLDAKSEGEIQIVSATIGKLDEKVDSNVSMTNEALSRMNAKLEGDMRTVSETVSKLDKKVDDTLQMTNRAIGDLYREKLSVHEFREFVNTFNKILSESFPLPEEPAPQSPNPAVPESHTEGGASFQGDAVLIPPTESDVPQNTETGTDQVAEEGAPWTIADDSSPESSEQASPPQVIDKATPPQEATVEEGTNKHVRFPMRVVGESFYVGDGVTSIVGDVEIPPGTTVDETLVVKGNFRSRERCRLLNNVKALKDIEIGDSTIVEGTLLSGGRVTVNTNCVVNGSIESDGNIEIGENVVVKKNLSSKLSIVLSKTARVFGAIRAAKGVFRP
jgi:hypothetical protein